MYQYKVKLDRVIDGDTIDCYIDLGFNINTKKRVRFAGINTPESRTRDLKEKKRGLAAKARLKEIKVLKHSIKILNLHIHQMEKFLLYMIMQIKMQLIMHFIKSKERIMM